MGIAIGLLLAVGAVAVIAWPFLRRKSLAGRGAVDRHRGMSEGPQAALQRARAEVYRLIRQLEADHAAGLVNDVDFRSQFDDLRGEAAGLMMEEAAISPMSDPAAELEREIAAARVELIGRAADSGRRDEG